MTEPRLPTHLWVMAEIKRCNALGLPTYLVRRGDAERGTVLLRIDRFALGYRLLVQARDAEGRLGWLEVGTDMAPPDATAYVDRAVARDPDLWVVEVEDRQGRNPFAGVVL
ncbi:MAG: DUF1491 family protein [Dongiaceae bacterium]